MNFTIEWFQYMTSDLGNPRVFSINSFPTARLAVSIESGIFRLWINSGIRFQEPVSLLLNLWSHFAIVYTNGLIKIYKNGQKIGNTIEYYSGMISDYDDKLYIGTDLEENSYFNGRLSNFRWTLDEVYSSNFNPLIQNYDKLDDTILLLKFDDIDDFVYDSSNTGKDTFGFTLSYSTSSPISGSGSVVFNGVDSYVYVEPVDDFDFSAVSVTPTVTPSSTPTPTPTVTISASASTTTTTTSTSTSTTSTTTLVPRVSYTSKVNYLYNKITKVASRGRDYYFQWEDIVDESLRSKDFGLLGDVVLKYYNIKSDRYASIEDFKKKSWPIILAESESSKNVQLKTIFDDRGVYQIGYDFFLLPQGTNIGQLQEISEDGREILRVISVKQIQDLTSATSSIFDKYGTGIDILIVDSTVTPTPTPTVSLTPSITPTRTLTPTPTPSNSPTITLTIPGYKPYFSPIFFNNTTNRYMSFPVASYFDLGNWSPSSDFTNGITRPTTNQTTPILAFSQSEFGVFNTGTTMSFIVYDGSGDILSQITGYTINSVGSTSSLGISLNVASFSSDGDRYKASVWGTLDLPTLLPNGGRFYYTIYHYNSQGPGNVSSGVYGYSSSSIFFDNDGPTSSINISGPIHVDEYSNSLVYYSGVAFYKQGQTFSLTASSINLLNDQTFPDSQQLRFSLTNMAISDDFDGFCDGSKPELGSEIQGWNINYNNTGLTFSQLVTVNVAGQFIPGFSTNNTISNSPTSFANLSYYDWGLVGTTQSSGKKLLFDTLIPNPPLANNNQIENEIGRILVSTITQSGTASFDSTQSLRTNYPDELQYLWGRVIFPQTDFTQFNPSQNINLDVNYSGLTGSTKTFNVFTNLYLNLTTPVTFTDYRWHVTSYSKDNGDTFGNGIFTINSNFLESYLDYDLQSFSSGTGDLVILLGIDNTGNNNTPDSFMYLSGNPVYYPGRAGAPTYNFSSGSEWNKKIKFDKGSETAATNKVWLLIGYKNSSNGKNLRFTDISLV